LTYRFDDCRFDASDGRLTGPSDGREVTLRPQAGRLLECFLEHPGEVLARETLCAAVWNTGTVVDFESGLAALIRELRQAFEEVGASAEFIETVPRRGYRFRPTVDAHRPGSGERWFEFTRPGLVLALVMILILASVGAFWLLRPASSVNAPTLAILPFERFGAPAQGGRVELLLPDTILADLWEAELEGLELLGRVALRPYRGREDVAEAVARDLDVNLIMEGTVTHLDGQWQVSARLLQMPRGRLLWGSAGSWSGEALPIREVAEALVGDLAAAWPELAARL